jgi:sugar diacid utilization regulator
LAVSSALFDAVLDGDVVDSDDRFIEAGYKPSEAHWVVVLAGDDEHRLTAAAGKLRTLLVGAAASQPREGVVLHVAVLAPAAAGTRQRLRDAVTYVARQHRVFATVQPPSTGGSDLRYRYRLALTELLVAWRVSAEPRVVTPGDVALHRALLGVDEETHRQLLKPVTPLLALPRMSREMYLRTIERVHLIRHARWQAALAAALDIHINTLRYRIARIEELTGLNPTHPGAYMTLFLGVLAYRLQEEQP